MTLPQDRSQQKHDGDRVRLLVPVIMLVLGTTAIPVELRRFDLATLYPSYNARDLLENLILYVPVGVVLTRLGFWCAVMIATLLSLFAETCQLFMLHRFSVPVRSGDERRRSDDRSADRLAMADPRAGDQGECVDRLAIAARGADGARAVAARTILALKERSDWEKMSVNCRGATLPGFLEAHWTFDEMVAGVIYDSSGNGLDGTLIGGTVLADGIHGMAVRVDGEKDYVDFGHPVELRLMGSMTICAWINSSSFPIDDAAIVSTLQTGLPTGHDG